MKHSIAFVAHLGIVLVAFASLAVADPQGAAPTTATSASNTKDSATPRTAAQRCTDGKGNKSTRFDPACTVRIFEDAGSGPRLLLYDADNNDLNSRILKADSQSTLVIDLSKAFDGEADAALSNVFIKATLKKDSSPAPMEVIGYSTIGDSSKDKASQNAFAFQTFDNIAGKLTNLFFTTRDLVQRVYPGEPGNDCYSVLKKLGHVEPPMTPADVAKCDIPAAEKAARLQTFDTRLTLYAPEASSLSEFFAKPENRGITAQLATDVFEIDIESLQGIALQIQDDRTKLASADTDSARKDEIRARILERIKLTVQDLSGVTNAIETIGKLYGPLALAGKDATSGPELVKACPLAASSFGSGIVKAAPDEFARRCYVEVVKPRYVAALRKFLVEGTIRMPRNDASDGDLITILIESQGADGALGIQAQWDVKVRDFGWKAGVKESLIFIKRLGVDEVTVNSPSPDPLAGVQPARFLPFPGFTLAATYLGKRTGAVVDVKKDQTGPIKYSMLERPGGGFLRGLSPGLGWNVTFMTFGSHRDYDPVAAKFTTTTGSNFEIGTGPMVSLFNNRLLVTYGWNLMQPVKREYWGLGFNFIQVGKDIAKFIK